MKRWILFVMLAATGCASPSLRLGSEPYDGMSLGVASWTNGAHGTRPAGYYNWPIVDAWDNALRLGTGMVVSWDDHPLLRVQTSLTTLLWGRLELGGWYAPFWGLIGADDPYGALAGVSFSF